MIYLLPFALLGLAVATRISASDILNRLSLICLDFIKAGAARARDASIRIVDIDDNSLSKIGQWPWPRGVVAQLVDRLHDAKRRWSPSISTLPSPIIPPPRRCLR
jgi:adenylate cyclase